MKTSWPDNPVSRLCVLVILTLLFLTSGCGTAIHYKNDITAQKIAPAASNQVDVLGKGVDWKNSGVFVEKGHRYRVIAEGSWSAHPGNCGWQNAVGDGFRWGGLCINWGGSDLPGYPATTLVGKVGKNGNHFKIGTEMTFTASETGPLLFRMNDNPSTFYDNDGFITVTTSNLENTLASSKIPEYTRAFPSRTFSGTGNSWTVVIGISKYQFSGQNGLTNLIFADDDAKAFARSLRNLGWSESHMKLLVNEDATQRNIMIALESWLSKAGPDDQIILFWSGHGFPDPEDPEKVYFACYDTDISIPATGYRMDKVRTALEERKSKNVILLADTCHAGKLITRGERGISIVPQINKMQREQKVPKGWVFMVGADTDRQAIEHTSWKNGAFTHSLIKGLNGEADGFRSAGAKDGIVTMGELKDYMNIAMPDETQKVLGVAKRPIITTSTGDPDIWNLTLQVKQ